MFIACSKFETQLEFGKINVFKVRDEEKVVQDILMASW
jgi:hypothetical protein